MWSLQTQPRSDREKGKPYMGIYTAQNRTGSNGNIKAEIDTKKEVHAQ